MLNLHCLFGSKVLIPLLSSYLLATHLLCWVTSCLDEGTLHWGKSMAPLCFVIKALCISRTSDVGSCGLSSAQVKGYSVAQLIWRCSW
jgi:hypothetical protein